MADSKQPFQEEEYLFSEDASMNDDASLGAQNEEPISPSGGNAGYESKIRLWRKNIILGIGFFLLVLLVYKVISSFFSDDEPQKTVVVPTAIKSVASQKSLTMNQSAVQNKSSVPATLPLVVSDYNQHRSDEQRVVKMETLTENLRTDVDDLKNTAQSLQYSMDNMNTQLAQINATLAVLANKMQKQDEQMALSRRKAKSVSKPSPVIKRMTYVVQAIVPGRAWLISSRGATITVGQGAEVPGYGNVVSIDPQLGKVVTSSGAVIEYSPDDQ